MKRNVLIGAFCWLLIGLSCTKEVIEPNSVGSELAEQTSSSFVGLEQEVDLVAELDRHIEEVELDAEADTPRSLKYKVKTDAGKLKSELILPLDEKPLYSLAVIAPKTGMTASNYYFCKLTWEKKRGANYFFVKKINVTTPQGQAITLDPKKQWRICGILSYTQANVFDRNVNFNPNQSFAQAISANSNEKVVKDIPLYFDWTDLKLKGQDASATNGASPAKIKIKPLGTLLRVSLTNRAGFTMRIKSMTVVSNGLVAGQGYLGWISGVGPHSVPLTSAYFARNGLQRAEEYKETFNLGSGVDIPAGATYPKSFLLWAYPKELRPNGVGTKYTKVMVSAVRLDGGVEKKFPAMNHLYGYWSTTNNLQAGKRHHVPVTLYRPKLALEYLSEGYLRNNNTFSNETDYYPYAGEVKSVAGYTMLDVKSVRAIMNLEQDIKFARSTADINKTMNAGDLKIGSTVSTVPYKEIYRNGDPSIFALRYDDGASNRQHYSVYQYEEGKPTGHIRAFYLGPNFKGTLDDILADAPGVGNYFSQYADDVIVRSYNKTESHTQASPVLREKSEVIGAGMIISHMARAGAQNYSLWIVDKDKSTRLGEVFNYNFTRRKNKSERKRNAPVVMKQTHDNFPTTNK